MQKYENLKFVSNVSQCHESLQNSPNGESKYPNKALPGGSSIHEFTKHIFGFPKSRMTTDWQVFHVFSFVYMNIEKFTYL